MAKNRKPLSNLSEDYAPLPKAEITLSPEEPGPGEEVVQPLSQEEEHIIVQLKILWLPHEKSGLDVRHKMGRLLNDRLGQDTQPRGREVIKQAAERLGLNVSDLYRMKAFSARFKSVHEFSEQYPDVQTWSGVKKLLGDLGRAEKASGGDGTSTAATEKASAKAKKQVIDLLAELRDKVKIVSFRTLNFEEVECIEEALKEFATALTPLLGTVNLRTVTALASAIKPFEE